MDRIAAKLIHLHWQAYCEQRTTRPKYAKLLAILQEHPDFGGLSQKPFWPLITESLIADFCLVVLHHLNDLAKNLTSLYSPCIPNHISEDHLIQEFKRIARQLNFMHWTPHTATEELFLLGIVIYSHLWQHSGFRVNRRIPGAMPDVSLSRDKIDIEIDDRAHKYTYKKQKDCARDKRLMLQGWRIWRIQDVAIQQNLKAVITWINAQFRLPPDQRPGTCCYYKPQPRKRKGKIHT